MKTSPSLSSNPVSSTNPIGIFDSGIGGLTVVAALQKLLPQESLYYIGDTARVPYGGKSATTVTRYSQEIIAQLLEQEVKLVVAACNTVSALALPVIGDDYKIPLLGVLEPSAAAAAAMTYHGRIGLIATKGTIASQAYEEALKKFDPELSVVAQATPLLVPLVEEGLLEDSITRLVLERYLEPLLAQKIDTLILGCTHYPLLKPLLQELLGEKVSLIDSAQFCAEAIRNNLEQRQLLQAPLSGSLEQEAGQLDILLTDSSTEFLPLAAEKLGLRVKRIIVPEVSLST